MIQTSEAPFVTRHQAGPGMRALTTSSSETTASGSASLRSPWPAAGAIAAKVRQATNTKPRSKDIEPPLDQATVGQPIRGVNPVRRA